MRRYLGVLASVAALCVISWAQASTPAPTTGQAQAPGAANEPVPIPTPAPAPPSPPPPSYPRIEFFAGGTYAEAGLFNAGHWAGLPGWDTSLALNPARWLGFVFEGGQFFGTSKIPVAVPAPFPINPCQPNCTGPTFNVDTRAYNFLFGAQFSRRKYVNWTPFGELMYGHSGTRGVENFPIGPPDSEVSSGRALVAGAGIDHKINARFALRIKADYLQTGTAFHSFKQKQDNFRVSVGIVIRNVHKKKRTLEEETTPAP
ncbi:MAG: autotransporter outer membrane beta-barrel domain-containing protein [Terriglobales bacterium]